MRNRSSVKSNRLFVPIRRNGYLVILFLLIAAYGASRYLQLATPRYQASATLKIEDPQGMANTNLYRDFDAFRQNNKVQTEVEVLRSRSIFDKAVDNLDFFTEYLQQGELKVKELYTDAPVKLNFVCDDSSFYSRTYHFQARGENEFILKATDKTQRTLTGRYGDEISDAGVRLTIVKNEAVLKNKKADYIFHPLQLRIYSKTALVDKLRTKDYLVRAVDKDVNIIRVYFTHEVPEKAVKLVNAIAKAYIDQSLADKQGIAGNTEDFINQQLALVGERMKAARESIMVYREERNIINIPQETDATYRTLADLEMQKVELHMQMSVLEHMSEYFRRNRELKFSAPEYEAVNDDLFRENVSRLNTLLREKEELEAKYTPDHEKVKNAEKNVAQIRDYLIESINNTRRKLLIREEELLAAIDQQNQAFAGMPEKESTLQELNRDYMLYEKVYNFLVEKQTEAMIVRKADMTFSRVLETATMPLNPFSPKPGVIWGLSMLVGLIFGVAAAYLKDYLRPSLKTPEDINPEAGIPVIGTVQQMRKQGNTRESFLPLATRILMTAESSGGMVISITSTRSGEGKSYIAANLARSLAAMDKRVILIDTNLRKPTLHEIFDSNALHGFSNVISRQVQLQDVIQITSIPNLDLITAGNYEEAGYLMPSDATRSLLNELKKQYDAIILDTPEVGVYVDAVPLMKWSDLNLYVVRADSGRDQLIANAEAVADEYRLKEVHYVVNAMKARRNHTGIVESQTVKPRTGTVKALLRFFTW